MCETNSMKNTLKSAKKYEIMFKSNECMDQNNILGVCARENIHKRAGSAHQFKTIGYRMWNQ